MAPRASPRLAARPAGEASRLRPAAQVREIWLSSEDTGAYGRDIGTSLPQLLHALVDVLPRGAPRGGGWRGGPGGGTHVPSCQLPVGLAMLCILAALRDVMG